MSDTSELRALDDGRKHDVYRNIMRYFPSLPCTCKPEQLGTVAKDFQSNSWGRFRRLNKMICAQLLSNFFCDSDRGDDYKQKEPNCIIVSSNCTHQRYEIDRNTIQN